MKRKLIKLLVRLRLYRYRCPNCIDAQLWRVGDSYVCDNFEPDLTKDTPELQQFFESELLDIMEGKR